MKSFVNTLLGLVTAIAMSNCNSELEKRDYIDWVLKGGGGMVQTVENANLTFHLHFRPLEYMFLQEHIHNSPTVEMWEEYNTEAGGLDYYTLTITPKINPSYETPQEVETTLSDLDYFSYSFQNDIFLVGDGGRQNPALFHFERSGTLDGARRFMIAFERPESGSKFSRIEINSEKLSPSPLKFRIKSISNRKLKL